MRTFVYVITLVVFVVGCKRSPNEQAAQAEEHEHTVSVTELFMEHPPLVTGEKARLVVHLTSLDNFPALRSGRVAVRLTRPEGPNTYSQPKVGTVRQARRAARPAR